MTLPVAQNQEKAVSLPGEQEQQECKHELVRGWICLRCFSGKPEADVTTGNPPKQNALSPVVAARIVAVRDALIREDYDEAYHQLYAIADASFTELIPWRQLEKLAELAPSVGAEAKRSEGSGSPKSDSLSEHATKSEAQPESVWKERCESASKLGLATGALRTLRFYVTSDIKAKIDSLLADLAPSVESGSNTEDASGSPKPNLMGPKRPHDWQTCPLCNPSCSPSSSVSGSPQTSDTGFGGTGSRIRQ